MNHTEYYNLNKPEATDFYDIADFNENADSIDAAIHSLSEAVAGKAAAGHTHAISDITGLQSALDSHTHHDLLARLAAVEEKLETVLAAFQGVWLRLDVDAFASMHTLGSNDWNNLYIHYNPLNGSWNVYTDEYINVATDFSTGDVIGKVLPQYRPSAVLTGTARIKIYQEDEAKDCTCQVKPDGSIVIAPELTPGLNVLTLYELTLSYDTTEANT